MGELHESTQLTKCQLFPHMLPCVCHLLTCLAPYSGFQAQAKADIFTPEIISGLTEHAHCGPSSSSGGLVQDPGVFLGKCYFLLPCIPQNTEHCCLPCLLSLILQSLAPRHLHDVKILHVFLPGYWK